jgi:lysozyme
MNSERLRDDLVKDEAIRLKPYRDKKGKLTIGIGRNLDDKGLSLREAYFILGNDISDVSTELFERFPWMLKLNDVRQNVFLNMAFNMGVQGLSEFKLTLAYAQGGHFDMAAREMLDSDWFKDVGDRAVRLSKQMAMGEFENVGKN